MVTLVWGGRGFRGGGGLAPSPPMVCSNSNTSLLGGYSSLERWRCGTKGGREGAREGARGGGGEGGQACLEKGLSWHTAHTKGLAVAEGCRSCWSHSNPDEKFVLRAQTRLPGASGEGGTRGGCHEQLQKRLPTVGKAVSAIGGQEERLEDN